MILGQVISPQLKKQIQSFSNMNSVLFMNSVRCLLKGQLVAEAGTGLCSLSSTVAATPTVGVGTPISR